MKPESLQPNQSEQMNESGSSNGSPHNSLFDNSIGSIPPLPSPIQYSFSTSFAHRTCDKERGERSDLAIQTNPPVRFLQTDLHSSHQHWPYLTVSDFRNTKDILFYADSADVIPNVLFPSNLQLLIQRYQLITYSSTSYICWYYQTAGNFVGANFHILVKTACKIIFNFIVCTVLLFVWPTAGPCSVP